MGCVGNLYSPVSASGKDAPAPSPSLTTGAPGRGCAAADAQSPEGPQHKERGGEGKGQTRPEEWAHDCRSGIPPPDVFFFLIVNKVGKECAKHHLQQQPVLLVFDLRLHLLV